MLNTSDNAIFKSVIINLVEEKREIEHTIGRASFSFAPNCKWLQNNKKNKIKVMFLNNLVRLTS